MSPRSLQFFGRTARWRTWVGFAVVVVALAGLAVVIWRARDDTAAKAGPPPPPAPAPASVTNGYDVLADSAGAVVYSRREGEYRGYNSVGALIWSQRIAHPFMVECLARCPDVSISGSIESFNSPELADPAVLWRVGAKNFSESSDYDRQPGRKLIMAASSQQRAVLAVGDLSGHYQLEFRDQPRKTLALSVPVPANQVRIVTDHDLTVAAALVRQPTTSTGSSEPKSILMWFRRDSTGWHAVGSASSVAYTGGCLAADGRAVLSSPEGSVLVRFGGQRGRRFADEGSCVINRAGPVVTVNSTTTAQGKSSDQTDTTQYDSRGTKLWASSVPSVAQVSGTPDSSRVVIADGTRYQVRGESGHMIAQGSAPAATAISGGRVVVVDSSGRPLTLRP